jgi:hypothetical protein
MVEMTVCLGNCSPLMERSGKLLKALTDRWRKLVAEIHADLGPNRNERQNEDCRLRFRQVKQDMFIPDNFVR